MIGDKEGSVRTNSCDADLVGLLEIAVDLVALCAVDILRPASLHVLHTNILLNRAFGVHLEKNITYKAERFGSQTRVQGGKHKKKNRKWM